MSDMSHAVLLHEISGLTKEEQWEPFAWYKKMRENCPVFYDPEQDIWNVFLYEHAKRVLTDHQLFSNKKDRSLLPTPKNDNRSNLNRCDPPEHQKRRALVAKAFTPRSLETWIPRIQSITDQLITEMEEQETVDIVEKLAVPLPVTVIADLLGVPSKDWHLIKRWSDIFFRPYAKDQFEDIELEKKKALHEYYNYLYPLVQEKRKNPTDDIISDLTQAELHGERLTDTEVIDVSRMLLGAGNETTTILITNIFYSMLFDQPGIYQKVRNDLSLVPLLVEEVLRFRFTASMDRKIAKDVEIFGHKMKKGQMIVAWMASANRDESKFSHAETFDIHRPNNHQHLTFGAGPHFCLGAPLARMEAKIALSTFIKRFANIHISDGFKLSEHLTPSIVGQSLKSFPIQLERE